VAEGGGLLNRYRVSSPIKGSNPFVSASHLNMLNFLVRCSALYFARNDAAGPLATILLPFLFFPLVHRGL
jgi:hypothetical protein